MHLGSRLAPRHMTSRSRIVAFISVTVAAILSGYSLWAHQQSPDRAKVDPWTVWVSVLKGFSGAVLYVGTKGPYAYFRIGSVFPTYYKTPACNTKLPRVFDLGAETPYVVVLSNLRGYSSTFTCDR